MTFDSDAYPTGGHVKETTNKASHIVLPVLDWFLGEGFGVFRKHLNESRDCFRVLFFCERTRLLQ